MNISKIKKEYILKNTVNLITNKFADFNKVYQILKKNQRCSNYKFSNSSLGKITVKSKCSNEYTINLQIKNFPFKN